MKVLFLPISIAAGLGAGQLARKVFDVVWSRFDDEEAPHPKYREIDMVKLVPALLVEGAIFRLVKGMTDHGLRRGFARLTGAWPGDERPEAV
jgi:hypothetical protein